jgi:hypothetical protein
MNTRKKIERYLRAAPKPERPDGLLDRLRKDVTLRDTERGGSVIRRWFAPTGQSISPWRVAAAAAIAIVVMLPLSYGAAKIIKFITEEFTVTYIYGETGRETGATIYGVHPTIQGAFITSQEDAKMAEKEILQFIKQGEAEEISPGQYKAVLSNGEEVLYDTDGIPIKILQSEDREKKIKQMCDEIEELKKAGNLERTFIDTVETHDGITVYRYKERFVLSDGSTVTMNAGYNTEQNEKNHR